MTWFHSHIPTSWPARPQMELAANTIITDLSSVFKDYYSDPAVNYKINSFGYRDNEYKKSYKKLIISLGMSSTFGLGVKLEDTYSSIISKKLNVPVLNFGIPGASSDTVARMATCLVPYFNKSNLTVLVGWPYKERREVFLDDFKASINFQNDPPIKDFVKLLDDTASNYNLEKNQLLVRSVCKANNVSLFEIPEDLYTTNALEIDKASDGWHPGPKWHATVAELFLAKVIL